MALLVALGADWWLVSWAEIWMESVSSCELPRLSVDLGHDGCCKNQRDCIRKRWLFGKLPFPWYVNALCVLAWNSRDIRWPKGIERKLRTFPFLFYGYMNIPQNGRVNSISFRLFSENERLAGLLARWFAVRCQSCFAFGCLIMPGFRNWLMRCNLLFPSLFFFSHPTQLILLLNLFLSVWTPKWSLFFCVGAPDLVDFFSAPWPLSCFG